MKGHKRAEGSILENPEETAVYYNIAKLDQIQTVCETGFNYGESAFLWLISKPNLKLYSFDLGNHPYAKKAAEYITEHFPGRFSITWGNSINTLPTFVSENSGVSCDLMVIDGGHFYAAALSDFENFAKMSHSGSIVILDNYPDERFKWDLAKVWEGKKLKGELLEVFKCNFLPVEPQGFAVGILQK